MSLAYSSKTIAVVAQVRIRARGLCEYCHASEQWQYVPFTVDHVMPLSLEGSDDVNNLALACFHCNRRKFIAVAAFDPHTNESVAIFNPRTQVWDEHFVWSTDGVQLVGLTASGRATIEKLEMNRERLVAIRAVDVLIGRHPPRG